MRIRRLSWRCAARGFRKNGLRAASGARASQLARYPKRGSRGLSVWVGRHGFSASDGGIGRAPGARRDQGHQLDRFEREQPLSRELRLRLEQQLQDAAINTL